ncbi:MAG: hypothetical protein OXC53_06490 [Rhodobacteraceae bacterium]|nr:hypothetical protein [Paracoccaceae bacterium]
MTRPPASPDPAQGPIRGFALITLVGAAMLLLTACGGGDNDTAAAPSRSDILAASPVDVQEAAARAATHRPHLGSVTQSSNATSGVTSETAAARFDGRGTQVTITRTGGSTLDLDSTTDRIGDAEILDSPLPGTTYHGERLLRTDANGTTLALVFTNWNDSDPTDYLAGGTWLHTDLAAAGGALTRAEVGAFVDGPELDTAPTLPDAGTARYQGRGAGLYAYAGSSRLPDQAGELRGNVDLTADFATRTLTGCLGCRDRVEIEGVTGDGRSFRDTVPMRMRLAATPFDATTGRFAGQDVTVEHDEIPITDSSGSWGGQVSSREVPVPGVDSPLIIVGTAGGEWTDVTGGQGALVGAWWGQWSPPQPPAP